MFHLTVPNLHYTSSMTSDVGLMGDQNNCVPIRVKTLEQPDDFVSGLCVEVPCWFVSKENRRPVD